jgi:hypothetical protein
MAAIDYKQILKDVGEELLSLRNQRATLEKALDMINVQIEAAAQLHNAVAPILGEPPISVNEGVVGIENLNELGISAAVRTILEANPTENFTAAQMRDRMTEKGYDWKDTENALPAVHTVLVRLAKGDVAVSDSAQGAKTFRLKPTKQAISLAGATAGFTIPNFNVSEILKAAELAVKNADLIGKQAALLSPPPRTVLARQRVKRRFSVPR